MDSVGNDPNSCLNKVMNFQGITLGTFGDLPTLVYIYSMVYSHSIPHIMHA